MPDWMSEVSRIYANFSVRRVMSSIRHGPPLYPEQGGLCTRHLALRVPSPIGIAIEPEVTAQSVAVLMV